MTETAKHYYQLFQYLNRTHNLLLFNYEMDEIVTLVISASTPDEKSTALLRHLRDEHKTNITPDDINEIVRISQQMANELIF